MQNKVAEKRVVEQFNKYLEYRKNAKRPVSSFGQELSAHSNHSPVRGARRYAPPHLSSHPKTITGTQANRIAKLAPEIQAAAAKHNVPVELICGIILQESGGNPRAVSSAGAKGLMQLMPGTAKRFGVKDSFDPRQNIDGGTAYVKWLLDKFDGNIELALAGYNAGEGNVEKYGNKVPPFAETKQYIPNVLGYTQSMINILFAARAENLPSHAKRA